MAAGFGVFAIWMALDRGGVTHPARWPTVLLNAPRWLSTLWIVVRVIGATVTVPAAEEIAFRGYLLRRLSDADFEAVCWRKFAWMPLIVSSAAFGLLHSERWVAGSLAGVVYALAMQRRGRIGDAVGAHALTNALIAILVLVRGDWQLW